MNKSKCKTKSCKKWHPTLSDVRSQLDYSLFKGCRCNEKIIQCALSHDVKITGIKKGIIQLTSEEIKMIQFILDNPDD